MKGQKGFTLIELVVVIVILGILAVTAAPKFMNLQGDARHASLDGLRGAINGAANIVYGKSAIAGVETKFNSTVSAGGESISTNYGYPKATADGIVKALAGMSGESDWSYKQLVTAAESTTPGQMVFSFTNYADQVSGANTTIDNDEIPKNCYLIYTEATSSAVATAKLADNACK